MRINKEKHVIKKNKFIQIILYIISALLLIASMPNYFNIPLLSFIALVPIILSLRLFNNKNKIIPIVFFGFIYTAIAYSWYVDIFSSIWGYLLILAVAFWHTNLIVRGVKLEEKLPSKIQIFILPLFYALFEFLQRNIPVVKEWWFISYPKSSWGFPEALWGLSLFGISGVTFIMLLSNNTIAKIIQNIIKKEKISKILYVNIAIITLYLGFGFYYVNNTTQELSYNVGVVSDMANDMSGQSNEGLYVKDKEISHKILKTNLELSNSIAKDIDFIVWSENEFFNYNDTETVDVLKKFAKDKDTTLVVDSYMKNKKRYDVAALIDSSSSKNYTKKRYLFSDEKKAGFVPSDEKIKVFNARGSKVGLGVCYDYHFENIIKSQALNGAKIILMPRDDDMKRNKNFPYYHSTDAVFRAIENNVAFVSANTNGASIIVDSNGEIKACSKINEKSAMKAKISINKRKTLYTKYGDWFGGLLAILFVGILIYLLIFKNKKRI